MWLIDWEEVILYRVIKGGREQIIPIKDNIDAGRFMCMDKEKYSEFIDNLFDEMYKAHE